MSVLKQIVRIAKVDLEGSKPVFVALGNIKGIGDSLSAAICNIHNIPRSSRLGSLSEEQIKNIERSVEDPIKTGIPSFMVNRQKDFETNKTKHIITSELKLTTDFDIKRLKKIKSYKGMRHAFGQPVRGQRTKAHFRTGKSLGVKKKTASKKKG